MRSVIIILCLSQSVLASGVSVSELGSNSFGIGLDGTGILIGQAERVRSGKWNYDAPIYSANNTFPTGVWYSTNTTPDPPNETVYDDPPTPSHALRVAQVMIGKQSAGVTWMGVAENAQLHSLALDLTSEVHEALGLNRLATMLGGQVRPST